MTKHKTVCVKRSQERVICMYCGAIIAEPGEDSTIPIEKRTFKSVCFNCLDKLACVKEK